MTRGKAASIHFLVCLLVAAAIVGILWFFWYPRPYFNATGGLYLFMILLGVDVVIGPLLTLIVFNPFKAKRLIKLDMAIIASVQITALAYGVHVLYEARPVFLVFNVDRFDIVSAKQVEPDALRKIKDSELRTLSRFGPRLVSARLPSNPEERNKILMSALSRGKDLPQMPEYYVPYEAEKNQVLAKAKSIAILEKTNPRLFHALSAFMAEKHRKAEDLAYLPVLAARGELIAILDKRSATVLDVLAVEPTT
jgi:hypothetical protein